MPDYELEHHRIDVGGLALHVVQTGPADGPVAILLHGFPEPWLAWKNQIGALTEAGYRLWLPDQRGYNLSDKPQGINAYRLDRLVRDVEALIERCGRERVVLMGHDWGGIVAWRLAERRPERLERVVIVNAPHPAAFGRRLLRDPRQLLRSAYIGFFQLPALPEYLLRRRRFALLVRALRKSSRVGTFFKPTMDEYIEAWSRPGALSGMLNWYRANLRPGLSGPEEGRVSVPLLLLWGTRDAALLHELAQDSLGRCERGRLLTIERAGHWVLHEEPDRAAAAILEFLAEAAPLFPPHHGTRPPASGSKTA